VARTLLLALLLSLGFWLACAPAEPLSPTRHAILICMDTVRYDAWELVRQHAPPPLRSPWDRAIRLHRMQSTAPWTLPAVASVLTGLYPNTHGAGHFPTEIADFGSERPAVLGDEFVTLTERLREAGFRTASFTASPMFRWGGFRQGFHGGRRASSGLQIVRDVEAWLDGNLRQAPDIRHFLYLHFMEAHKGAYFTSFLGKARPEDAKQLAEARAAIPAGLREAALTAAPGGVCTTPGPDCEGWLQYIAAILTLRDAFTDLLTGLEERGLLAETAIALFSDHGEEFLDHRDLNRARELHPRNEGLGHGHTLFQEQLHVPVVLWHPSLAGGDFDVPSSLTDLAPTLLDWVGVEAPAADGVALGPALAGGDFDPERPLFSGAVAFGPRRETVLRGGRKLLSGGGHTPDLIFDLDHDPAESGPGEVRTEDLAALLEDYRRRRREAQPPATIDAQTLRELQAIGYLEDAEPARGTPEPE